MPIIRFEILHNTDFLPWVPDEKKTGKREKGKVVIFISVDSGTQGWHCFLCSDMQGKTCSKKFSAQSYVY